MTPSSHREPRPSSPALPGGAGRGEHERGYACTGRVAWVIQRLDLSDRPPFFYDVGVEFVELPRALQQLLAPKVGAFGYTAPVSLPARKALPEWRPAGGRLYQPTLARVIGQPKPWHLVVAVDGTPCFSGHYASERQALDAWGVFKRQQKRGG